MNVEITVAEAIEIFNGIQKQPEVIFDLIREDIKNTVRQTRTLSSISENLIRARVSVGKISKVNGTLVDGVEKRCSRDLSDTPIKYLFINGVNFPMLIEGDLWKVPVLLSGYRRNRRRGYKLVLCPPQARIRR